MGFLRQKCHFVVFFLHASPYTEQSLNNRLNFKLKLEKTHRSIFIEGNYFSLFIIFFLKHS